MCRCTMYIQVGNEHTTRKSQFLIFSGNFGSFELKRIVVCRKFWYNDFLGVMPLYQIPAIYKV